MLKEIIHPDDCARCKLCCNFHSNSVWESPFLEEDQATRIRESGVPLEFRERGGWSFSFRFKGDEAVNCPELNPETGCMLSPKDKPFECKIWPLRLMREGTELLVGRYRSCPALVGDRVAALDLLATGSLLPVLLAFAGSHPESIRARAPEYEIIWRGPLPGRPTSPGSNHSPDSLSTEK